MSTSKEKIGCGPLFGPEIIPKHIWDREKERNSVQVSTNKVFSFEKEYKTDEIISHTIGKLWLGKRGNQVQVRLYLFPDGLHMFMDRKAIEKGLLHLQDSQGVGLVTESGNCGVVDNEHKD